MMEYWKFDEMSGATMAADLSGNGRHLTLTNMDPATDWVTGYTGNALDFDGSNDYALGSGPSIYASMPMSVSLWHKGTSIALGDQDSVSRGFDIITNGACVTALYLNTYDNRIYEPDNFCIPAAEIHDGTWHFFTFVIDSTSARLYLDGVLKDTQAWVGTPSAYTASIPLRVGQRGFYASHFANGAIDELRIYNRALTPSDMLQIMASSSSCTLPNGLEGTMIYNTGHKIVQYCNGSSWVGVGK